MSGLVMAAIVHCGDEVHHLRGRNSRRFMFCDYYWPKALVASNRLRISEMNAFRVLFKELGFTP